MSLIDLTGQRFGRLVVVKFVGCKNRQATWLCRCDCGNEFITTGTRMADDNVVTAVMYEVIDGEKYEIARNHGHIIHSGVIGVAQAASFALKKIYIGMNDGKLIGLEGN